MWYMSDHSGKNFSNFLARTETKRLVIQDLDRVAFSAHTHELFLII